MTRSPPWVEDELLLVLHLYLQERRVLEEQDPRVVDVSGLLNRLPLHAEAGRPGFRSPDAVVLKLANFRSHDPQSTSKGMTNAGRRTQEVWERYADESALLERVAEAVRVVGDTSQVGRDDLFDSEPDEEGVPEGRLLYRMHRRRERRPDLRARKLKQMSAAGGELCCEVCSLSPARVFGPSSDRVLECHHLHPLALGERTSLASDVALVCANCHRALHGLGLLSTLEELRAVLPSPFVAVLRSLNTKEAAAVAPPTHRSVAVGKRVVPGTSTR